MKMNRVRKKKLPVAQGMSMMFLGPFFILFPFPPSFCSPLPLFCFPPLLFCFPPLLFHFPPPSFYSHCPIILVIHPASKKLTGMGWVVLGTEAVQLLCLLVSCCLICPVVLHCTCEQLLTGGPGCLPGGCANIAIVWGCCCHHHHQ